MISFFWFRVIWRYGAFPSPSDPVNHTYLQFKDIGGKLLQTVFREVYLLQVSPPEDGDRVWKTLDLIIGSFVLFLHRHKTDSRL